jgi:hypothetical protein
MITYSPTERLSWYRDGLIWRRVPTEKTGHRCEVCDELISERATYCPPCGKSRASFRRRPPRKDCPDCGVQIAGESQRCRPCAAKFRSVATRTANRSAA